MHCSEVYHSAINSTKHTKVEMFKACNSCKHICTAVQSGMYCNVKKSSFRKIKLALYNCKLVKWAAICDVCNFLLETVFCCCWKECTRD